MSVLTRRQRRRVQSTDLAGSPAPQTAVSACYCDQCRCDWQAGGDEKLTILKVDLLLLLRDGWVMMVVVVIMHRNYPALMIELPPQSKTCPHGLEELGFSCVVELLC